MPSRFVLLRCLIKLGIWCWSWISQIFLILNIWGWSNILVGIVWQSFALCLTRPICCLKIFPQMDLLRTMFWSRYSKVGIITILMIYLAWVSVICLVLAILMSCDDSERMSWDCWVCLLLRVNQQPRNLKGWCDGHKGRGSLLKVMVL